MNNFNSLLKKSINNNTLDNIPEEAFNGYDQLVLIEGKSQSRKLQTKPTLKSIASELLNSRASTDHQDIRNTIKSISQAADLDDAQYELDLIKALTQAKINVVAKLNLVYQDTKDKKNIKDLEERLMQLSQQGHNQLQKPVNAKQYQLLEKAEMDELTIGIDWLIENHVPFKKKVLYAFIATTNGGKTIIKTWLAGMFMRSGHNVLYLAQEEPYSDTIRRIYQSVLGLTEKEYAEQTKTNFEDVGKQFNKISNEKLYGDIFVVEWPNIKISQLKRQIQEFKQVHGIKLDAVFIDYGKLVDIDYVGSSKQEWERIGLIFKELKAMCMELNICVVTSIQLNREASAKLLQKGETPDLTSVAGAFEATHHANYIWSVKLNYTTDKPVVKTKDTVEGTFTLHVQKQKYGDLRPGDNMSFVWTSDHMLMQSRQQPTNEAPEPTMPWTGNYQVTDELPDNLDEIL